MDKQGITHILFDLGNVLVELRPVEAGAAMCPALLVQQARINPIVTDFECGRVSTIDFLASAPRELGLQTSTEQFRRRFQHIVGEWYTEVPALLQALRPHFHLGCLSNTNPLHIEALTQRGPHLALLHDCFFSHEIGCMKPSRTAYAHVLDVWQIAPARILFLDDRQENVLAAQAAGMQAVHAVGPKAVQDACNRLLPRR